MGLQIMINMTIFREFLHERQEKIMAKIYPYGIREPQQTVFIGSFEG